MRLLIFALVGVFLKGVEASDEFNEDYFKQAFGQPKGSERHVGQTKGIERHGGPVVPDEAKDFVF